MSANAIWFEDRDNAFYFDGQKVRREKLGRLIADALVNGVEDVDFHYCSVTVNYLVEMLRFTGANGWFWDCLDHTGDHRFDRNTPTPGTRFGEVEEMRAEARDLFRQAAEWRGHGQRRYNRRKAEELEAQGRELMQAARLRQMPGISR